MFLNRHALLGSGLDGKDFRVLNLEIWFIWLLEWFLNHDALDLSCHSVCFVGKVIRGFGGNSIRFWKKYFGLLRGRRSFWEHDG
jgi:hypothetical protein